MGGLGMQRLLIKMQNVRAFEAMEVVAGDGACAASAAAAAAVHLVVSAATARKKIR